MGDSQGVARPMDHSSAEPSSQTVPAETHGGGGGSTTATGCPFPNAAGTEQSQGKVGDTSALSHDAKASGCPVPHLSADSTAAATKAAGCPFPHTARKPDSRGAAAKAAGCPFPHPAGDAVPSVPPGFYADTSTGTHSHDATTAAAEPATTDRDGNRQNQQETLAAPEAGPSETTQQHAAGEVAEGHTGQREGVEVSASEAGSASQPAEEPLKCPLGFGAGNQAKLDPLNCMLCRALYFDAVRTQCGHVFCRACVEKGESCAICGADCRPLQSDDDMQGTVDKYVEVHSRDHKLTAGGNVAPQDQDVAEKHPQATRAAFFLQIGLRSLAGGNFHAAAARLEACHDALQSQASEEAAEGPEGLAVRLGAVCGSQGDCALRLDDGTGAARKYEEALRHLDSCASPSSELLHAKSVTLNKMGDLAYMGGDLATTQRRYEQALELRRSAASSPAGQLDLAASLVKVADVRRAVGGAAIDGASPPLDGASPLLEEAAALVAAVAEGGGAGDLFPGNQRKLAALQGFLGAQ